MLYEGEVFRIVGCAINVLNTLGIGFLEAVYQETLEMELDDAGIPYCPQKRINIRYKNVILKKEYIADFLCYDAIIVEIKVIKRISEIEEAQLLNYLKATGLSLGIIINFGNKKLEWKRYAMTQEI